MPRIGTLKRAAVCVAVALTVGASSVHAQEVSWRYDYTAARREAREKGRPILLDFGTHDCFWCRKLDEITFRDPLILRQLTDNFIPIKIDALRDAKLAKALKVTSFPTLVFAAPDGKILETQEGFADAAAFGKKLQQVLDLVNQPAAGASRAPDDRTRGARELLALAREDYRTQQFLCCLERCRALTTRFADLPEAAEAQQLAGRVRSDPDTALQACLNLTDSLGELYLNLAEGWLRAGQTQQAIGALERTVQACPGTRHAQTAQQRLAQLRENGGRLPPIVRSQAP